MVQGNCYIARALLFSVTMSPAAGLLHSAFLSVMSEPSQYKIMLADSSTGYCDYDYDYDYDYCCC